MSRKDRWVTFAPKNASRCSVRFPDPHSTVTREHGIGEGRLPTPFPQSTGDHHCEKENERQAGAGEHAICPKTRKARLESG